MKKWFYLSSLIVIALFMGSNVEAIQFNNPYSYNLIDFESASGGNITSITSGNNCIIIYPTTGEVIITFNLSCSGVGGGGITLDQYFDNATQEFYSILNPFGFFNSTNPQTELDPLWSSNFSTFLTHITLQEYFDNATLEFYDINNPFSFFNETTLPTILNTSGIYIFNDSTTIFFNTTLAGTNLTVNASNITNFIDTNIGFIGDVNVTQLENNGGTLSIIPNWLESFINSTINLFDFITQDYGNETYRLLPNHTFNGEATFNGNTNFTGHNLTSIGELQAVDGSAIKIGDGGTFTGIGQALNLQTNQTLGPGIVSHILTDLQGETIIEAWQNGKNNSWGYHHNSFGIFTDFGSTNGSFLTAALEMWNTLGIQPAFDYDSENQGASLGVEFGLELQQLIIHNTLGNGILNGGGLFSWVGNLESTFDVSNTSIHTNLGERLENVTTGAGPLLIKFISFEGESIGTQPPEGFEVSGADSGSSTREWSIRDDNLCGEDPCARSKGGNGGDIRGMDTNFSTSNVTGISLSFDYGSRNMLTGAQDGFDVQMNNNEGSGWILIFNDTTTTGDTQTQEQFTLPSSMENKSIVTLQFNHHASNQVQESFVDTIKVNGTLGMETVVLTSQYDGEIIIGSLDHDEAPCRLFFNDSIDTLQVVGDNCIFEALKLKGNTVMFDCAGRNVQSNAYLVMDGVNSGATTGFMIPHDGSIISASVTVIASIPIGGGFNWTFRPRINGLNTAALDIVHNVTGGFQIVKKINYDVLPVVEGDVLTCYAKEIDNGATLNTIQTTYEVAYHD